MSRNPFGVRNDSPSTNNPFVPNSATSRFPAIDGALPQQQQPQQQGYTAGVYQQPQQIGYIYQNQPPFHTPAQPVFPAYGQPPSSSQPGIAIGPQPTGFQPQSAFGQQMTGQLGQPNPYNLPYGGGTLSQESAAQLQTSSSSYTNVADLDPYSSLAQLPWAQPTRPPNTAPQSSATSSLGGASWNDEHPRSFVRDHKAELEGWRSDAWKGLRGSVEKLKQAWIGRKELVIKAMQGYGTAWDPVDAQRVQDLLHEADANIDLVTASSFQLEEAELYRHSSDNTSRSRVREALNAGLRSLPEWPEDLQTSRGVTMGYNEQPPLQIAMMPPQQQQFQSQQTQVVQQPFQQSYPRSEPLTGWPGGGLAAQPSYPQSYSPYK